MSGTEHSRTVGTPASLAARSAPSCPGSNACSSLTALGPEQTSVHSPEAVPKFRPSPGAAAHGQRCCGSAILSLAEWSRDSLSWAQFGLAIVGFSLIGRVSQHPPHRGPLPPRLCRSRRDLAFIQPAGNRVDAQSLLDVRFEHQPHPAAITSQYAAEVSLFLTYR